MTLYEWMLALEYSIFWMTVVSAILIWKTMFGSRKEKVRVK